MRIFQLTFFLLSIALLIPIDGLAFFHDSPLNFCEYRILPTGIVTSELPVEVSVRARNDSCTNDNPAWGSTLFRFYTDNENYGNVVCKDHDNHEGAFDETEAFSLDPNLDAGVYRIYAAGFSTDDCSGIQRRQWSSILWLIPEAEPEGAVFDVWKWFNDDNPEPVPVHIDCSSGLPATDSVMVSNGETGRFVVTNFESGTLDCDVWEELPDGYSNAYNATHLGEGASGFDPGGCQFTGFSHGSRGLCLVSNFLQHVYVTVEKKWTGGVGNAPLEVAVRLECFRNLDQQLTTSLNHTLLGDDWINWSVNVHWSGETCSIYEAESPDYEGESNTFCSEFQIYPGYSSGDPDNPGQEVDWCIWTNTGDYPITGMTITKTSTTQLVTTAGEVVPYEYMLSNTGQVTLHDVFLTDDNVDAPPVCQFIGNDELTVAPDPASSVLCTAQHTVTPQEIEAGGTLDNTATAASDETKPVVASLSIPIIPPLPAMAISKTSTTQMVTTAGEVVPYNYVIRNTGKVTLHDVALTDDNVDAPPVCRFSGNDELLPAGSPGSIVACEAEHTVTPQEIAAEGTLDNTATATSDEAQSVMASLGIPIGISLGGFEGPSCPCWTLEEIAALPLPGSEADCVSGPTGIDLTHISGCEYFHRASFSEAGLSCSINRFDCTEPPDAVIDIDTTDSQFFACLNQIVTRCEELGIEPPPFP